MQDRQIMIQSNRLILRKYRKDDLQDLFEYLSDAEVVKYEPYKPMSLAEVSMTKHIANILTACRILGSIFLLFFPAFSVGFYILYIFCGFSDMIDGTIARKANSTSNLGSRLDTVADLIFVAVSSFKLLPAIHIPGWLWIWGGVIAIIKIGNIFIGFISKKALISVHTIMNKLTGLLLFLLPLTISFIEPQYSAIVVCSIATFSAIQEGVYVMIDAERDPLPN